MKQPQTLPVKKAAPIGIGFDDLLEGSYPSDWQVRRTIWPFEGGYGVYSPSRRTMLNHGLSKSHAQALADHENGKPANDRTLRRPPGEAAATSTAPGKS